MNRIKYIAMVLALVCVTVGASELQTWTSTSGATVEARYVKLSGKMLTIEQANGERLAIGLDRLVEADRTAARKLAVAAGHIADLGTGETSRASPDRLPVFSDGKWKGMHTVYETENYRGTIDAETALSIQPRELRKDSGEAFGNSFSVNYMDPSRPEGNQRVRRRIVSSEASVAPATVKSGRHTVVLEGTLDNGVSFTRSIVFEPRTIRVSTTVSDGPSTEHPSDVWFGLRFAAAVSLDEYDSADKLLASIKGWSIALEGPDGLSKELEYSELANKVAGVDEATLQGPWGRRVIHFDMPPTRIGSHKSYTWFGIYQSMPPYSGFGLARHCGIEGGSFEADYTIEIK